MFQGSVRAGFLAAILLSVAMALGQTAPITNSYDISVINQVAVNSCSAGEPVALSGTVHLTYSFTTDSSGTNHFVINAADELTGLGQNSGLTYAANESAQYESNSDDNTADLTVELKSDLQPQGSGIGLTLVQSLHITVDTGGNISGQVVSNSTSCGS
jgi:hypothetical protein